MQMINQINDLFFKSKRRINTFFFSKEMRVTKKFFINSLVFILFSFLNVFLPVCICLITSIVDNKAAYATIGIGYITSFQLAYSQIGFAFAFFSSCLILKRERISKSSITSSYNIVYETLLLAFIYGIIITPLYIGPCYLYNNLANEHYNTVDSLQPANYYIFSSSGFVLFTSISWTLIFFIYNQKNSLHALIQIFINFGSILILSSVLSLYTPLKYIGVGLGLTIGTVISCICAFIHCLLATNYFKYKITIKWLHIKLILSEVWRQTLMVISIQIFKALALLMINLKVPEKLENAVPLNYQMSRLIWYNVLYLIPFFILGLSDSSYYFFVKYKEKVDKCNIKIVISIVAIVAFVLSIGIAIGCSYTIKPIANLYIRNQEYSYDLSVISNNVEHLAKDTIVDLVNQSTNIPNDLKNEIINILNSPNQNVQEVIDGIMKIVTQQILLPKFSQFDANEINSLLNLPKSYAYIYLSVYCILYPLGTLLNSFLLNVKNEKAPAILMVFLQGVAIGFIVYFGMSFQETTRFYLMEAWSFPLAIIGIVAFIYLAFNFFIKLNYQKK